METMKFRREELLTALKANREGHREQFETAIAGFEELVTKTLADRLKEARAGKRPNLHFAFPEPQDHTRDYDRVIRMLEMATQNEIELEEHEFAQYVQDDWGWKQQFMTSNSMYMSVGSAALAKKAK